MPRLRTVTQPAMTYVSSFHPVASSRPGHAGRPLKDHRYTTATVQQLLTVILSLIQYRRSE